MIKPISKRNTNEPISGPGTLDKALGDLRKIVLDGLRHGFFEFQISGEMLNENKRRLVIKAGKSHRYIISPEDLS